MKTACNNYDYPEGSIPENGMIDEGIAGIMQSFAEPSSVRPMCGDSRHPLALGDKVSIRMVPVHYGTASPVTISTKAVADYSDIIGEVRHVARTERDLWRMNIRNVTRGWACQKYILLYADSQRRRYSGGVSVTHPVQQPDTVAKSEPVIPRSLQWHFNH